MKLKYFVIVFFLLLGGFFISAEDVIVKQGELTVESNLLVNTETLYVDSTNNRVGIGTAAPTTKLMVDESSDASAIITIDSGSSSAQYSTIDFYDRGTNEWGIGKDTTNNFYIDEYGVDSRLIIQPGGNVGIGTTSPSEKLDVVGNVKATSFIGDGSQLTGVGGGLPSGMIAMFDTTCPSGWTRLTALDGRFLVGGSTYNTAAGGSDSITLTESNLPSHTHTVNVNDPGHSHSINDPGHSHSSETPHNNRCVRDDACNHNNEADINWQGTSAASTGITINSATTGITASASNTGSNQPFDNRPAYATIVICRKD